MDDFSKVVLGTAKGRTYIKAPDNFSGRDAMGLIRDICEATGRNVDKILDGFDEAELDSYVKGAKDIAYYGNQIVFTLPSEEVEYDICDINGVSAYIANISYPVLSSICGVAFAKDATGAVRRIW